MKKTKSFKNPAYVKKERNGLRIITGSARGFRLETLAGDDTRPTAERVKEGIFSALQFEIEGRQVLDMFAGSGQMGLEALSRGAAGCVFIDKSPDAVAVIRRNLNGMARRDPDIPKRAQVLNTDGLSYLARSSDKYDIAFLDPPYSSGLLIPALQAVHPHMNPGGVIVCESDSDTYMPEHAGLYTLSRIYSYGRVRIRLYRWENV
ncbi:MAG: 16S rRNA (guanine(966)-N(2))-methyltransferase RsmD [Clostridiales bacterium]|nr:16S rRNA (guanine(966)-N(2))-methyltransferase RsmD [Clostridiales bacterium]